MIIFTACTIFLNFNLTPSQFDFDTNIVQRYKILSNNN